MIANIQFWMSDYFIRVLGASKEVTFITFAAVCISAPAIGLILGGVMVSWLGGYEGKHTFIVTVGICWLGAIIGLPFPWADNFGYAVFMVWMTACLGSVVQSSFTGILMSLVTPDLRAQAYAIV